MIDGLVCLVCRVRAGDVVSETVRIRFSSGRFMVMRRQPRSRGNAMGNRLDEEFVGVLPARCVLCVRSSLVRVVCSRSACDSMLCQAHVI